MQKRRVFINAIMSVVQVVLVSGILFFLYKYLLKTIGVKQLGIWSLVLATTSVTQVANFGLSGSVVKFVAKYVARREDRNVSGVIQTAAISIGALIGLVLLAGYPAIRWVLGLVVSKGSFEYAAKILPFALFSLWLTTITGVFQSGLDGFQKIYVRNFLMIGGAACYALLCFVLAPNHGLIGLAYAQIINNSLILIFSWILIKKFLPVLPVIPYQWNRNLFKEIISYGINFQAISIAQMFYDPITKALLSKFGDLSMVGYYEMANRMVLQFRALIVSANQVVVPAVANLQERTPERINDIYLKSYQLLFYLALPLYSLLIICMPIISELWIGHYENVFVVFGTLLSIGWLLNTLAGPAYFTNLGIGELRWNVIGHMAIALLNTGLGFLLGVFYAGFGIVVAWVVSLSLGSSVIYISYHLRHRISLSELLPKENKVIIVMCLIGILSTLMILHNFDHTFNKIALNIIALLVFLIIVSVPIWLHPMRKRIMGWITNELLNRETGTK